MSLVISFPCIVTSIEGKRTISRRTWIEGQDLRALAIAATAQMSTAPDSCRYTLFTPDVRNGGVFLEVVRTDAEVQAHVGPMSGPTLPVDFPRERHYDLSTFLAALGFAFDGGPLVEGTYLAIVKDAGIWNGAARPPVRDPRHTWHEHKRRCDAAERAHVERSRHEGVHLVDYRVPPVFWTMEDLERLMALAYRLLPETEPRWPEAGAVALERCPDPTDASRVLSQCCLQVARGDCVAHLRLPGFPGGRADRVAGEP
jgi:hypothetical protein